MQVGRITTAAVILGLAVTCSAGASASAATRGRPPFDEGHHRLDQPDAGGF